MYAMTLFAVLIGIQSATPLAAGATQADMIAMLWRQPDARPVVEPVPASRLLFPRYF
jgi:hypothetical protein